MPTGLGTAALIAGLTGAGASLFGASQSASAAKDAAAQQAASADKALALEKGIYGDTKSALSPYVTSGQTALNNLMAQHWGTSMQPGNSQALQRAAQMYTPGAPGNAFMSGPGGLPVPNYTKGIGTQGSAPNSLAAMQGQPMQQPGGGGMPERGPELGGGGMVTVQDDTGATRQVPSGQADLYTKYGFKVLA